MIEIVLRPFQSAAAEETLIPLDMYEYGHCGTLPNGIPFPAVRLISAITGAGKTPILAKVASGLKDSIILWTTPASAVITQTAYKLQNQYRHILGDDVKVYSVDTMTPDQWNTVLNAPSGISILVCTVALFNIEDKEGRSIHDSGRWTQLKEVLFGGSRERKRLFVVYDEGHNLTAQQANLLLELSPRAVIMASGSDQKGGGLSALMHTGGKPWAEVIPTLTTKVDTPRVVKESLLKRRIEMAECDLDRRAILDRAVKQRQHLEGLVGARGETDKPIACYVVSDTKSGIEVWDELRALGVPANKIAVHLSGAKKAVEADTTHPRSGFWDTYAAKMSPIEIQDEGFTHIIWNKALKEGWDEPWAFVAYIDGVNSSIKDIQQKIGRFIRNPFRNDVGEPVTPFDEELQTAYFYLRQDNEQFKQLLAEVKKDMTSKYPGVIEVSTLKREYQEIPSREAITIPKLRVKANRRKLEKLLEDSIITPARKDCVAKGTIITGALDLESEMVTIREAEKYGTMVQATVAEVVKEALRQGDRRLIDTGWLDSSVWDNAKMRTKIAYSSPAYSQIKAQAEAFLEKVPVCLEVVEAKLEWEICPVKIAMPRDGETDPKIVEMVREANALHEVYNGLNDDEREVAHALGKATCKWFRNPATVGYGIGLKRASLGSTNFYPDFIAIKDGRYFFIEPKGAHLLEDTKLSKLLQLPGSNFDIFVIVSADDGRKDVYTTTGKKNFESAEKAVNWILEQ
jgi:type III restriction enzyme